MRPAETFYESAGLLIGAGIIASAFFGWSNLLAAGAGVYLLLIMTNGFERGYNERKYST